MGVYDTYGDVQIKAGDCVMEEFKVGDKTNLGDGVYVAPDGVVVIVGGKFVAQFDHLTDKWGNQMSRIVPTRPQPTAQAGEAPPFKVGDKVVATGNYEDEQLGEFAYEGEQTVLSVEDVRHLEGTGGWWITTDHYKGKVSSLWFRPAPPHGHMPDCTAEDRQDFHASCRSAALSTLSAGEVPYGVHRTHCFMPDPEEPSEMFGCKYGRDEDCPMYSPQLPTPDDELTRIFEALDNRLIVDNGYSENAIADARGAVEAYMAQRLALQAKAADERFEAALGPDEEVTRIDRKTDNAVPKEARNNLRAEARQRWYKK